MRYVLPASHASVDAICADVRARMQADGLAAHDFAVQLLLREALTNAVLHGSGLDGSRTVRCAVRLVGGWLLLRVGDDGPGFDWRARLDRTPDELGTSGRGVATYALYADRVRFNEIGNRVWLRRRIGRGCEG